MTKREFMEQLNHMAEEGMVRKSDVISIVEKQKLRFMNQIHCTKA